ncbi:MAG: hypothetical protein ACRD2L_22250, partial [Terriglobia bacterium]
MTKPGEILRTEPTLYRLVEDEAGNLVRSGVPAFSADMQHGLRLPSLEKTLEYVSSSKRWLKVAKDSTNPLRRIPAKALKAGSSVSDVIGRVWKHSVLIGKMPAALPARIIGEEMVRSAAFGHASLVNHPVQWFRSVRSGGEFSLFAEYEASQLGLLGDQFFTGVQSAQRGKTVVSLADGSIYFDGLGDMISRRFNSPEIRHFYRGKTPEEALAYMLSPEGIEHGGEDITRMIDSLVDERGLIKTREDAIRRIKLELKQIAGTGEGAEKVAHSLYSGEMLTPDGSLVEAGTKEFSDELARMQKAGEWTPGVAQVPVNDAHLTFGSKTNELRSFRDKIYGLFYSKPDLYLSRAPLFRQIARREYDRLVS